MTPTRLATVTSLITTLLASGSCAFILNTQQHYLTDALTRSDAAIAASLSRQPQSRRCPSVLALNEGETDGDRDVGDTEFPCLPAIGDSSYRPEAALERNFSSDGGTAFVSEKFELQYTCNVCETRNSNRVSRIAYRNGVVICVCKGCMSKHLIADNLGWSNYIGGFEGDTNIEEYLSTLGREDDVMRVSPDVFDLEWALKLPNGESESPAEDEKDQQHFE